MESAVLSRGEEVVTSRGEGGSVDEQTTDAELLSAVADGSTAALELLYRRHSAWSSIRLGRRCADP